MAYSFVKYCTPIMEDWVIRRSFIEVVYANSRKKTYNEIVDKRPDTATLNYSRESQANCLDRSFSSACKLRPIMKITGVANVFPLSLQFVGNQRIFVYSTEIVNVWVTKPLANPLHHSIRTIRIANFLLHTFECSVWLLTSVKYFFKLIFFL